MIASGVNLVMTVIGFAVSTMFIVFVCTRLICARIQLNAARRSFPTATRSDLGMLERGLHGLEPVVVAKFPTKKISDEYFASCTDTQGHDIESNEMLTQGFTHVFSMTFRNSEDLTAYLGHPSHVAFSTTFSEAIEKILLFDFPAVVVKASA